MLVILARAFCGPKGLCKAGSEALPAGCRGPSHREG